MKLFKKKEEVKSECCGGNCTPEKMKEIENTKFTQGIKVLGTGCAKCNALEEAVKTAVSQLKMDITIEHISDFATIASYGVMSTPALVVNGKIVAYGKVLSVDEVKKILIKQQ